MKTQVNILIMVKPFSFLKKAFTVFLFCFLQQLLANICSSNEILFLRSEKPRIDNAFTKACANNIHSQKKKSKSLGIFSDLKFQSAIFPTNASGKYWVNQIAPFIAGLFKIIFSRNSKTDFHFFSFCQPLCLIVRPPPFINFYLKNFDS